MVEARRIRAKLDAVELPDSVKHVWEWFLDLHFGRNTGGFGPGRLTYPDIDAWSRLTRTIIRPGEVRAILAVDNEWLRAQMAAQPKPATKPKPERAKR